MTMDLNEMNRGVIAEFRANAGKVGGPFEGAPMLLLHTVGAKSGEERINPLVYRPLTEVREPAWVIFASAAGAPKHPAWYHNLLANSEVTIEVGTETVDVIARIADAEERDKIFTAQKTDAPQFAEYEKSAGDRVIPVVILERS